MPFVEGFRSVTGLRQRVRSHFPKRLDDTTSSGALPPLFRYLARPRGAAVLATAAAAIAIAVVTARDGAARELSVAVLPFATLGVDSAQYVADGLADELATSLGKVQGIRVVSRTLSHGLDSLRKFVESIGLSWEPPNKADYRKRLERMWSRYDGRDLLDPRPPSGRIPPSRMDDLANVRVPTLIIVGDHEVPLFRLVADTLARRIPNARHVVITDGGHGAHFAQPERFNSALLEFLTSVSRTATQSPERK